MRARAKPVPTRDPASFVPRAFDRLGARRKGIDRASEIHTFEEVAVRLLGKSRCETDVLPKPNPTQRAELLAGAVFLMHSGERYAR